LLIRFAFSFSFHVFVFVAKNTEGGVGGANEMHFICDHSIDTSRITACGFALAEWFFEREAASEKQNWCSWLFPADGLRWNELISPQPRAARWANNIGA
jgi:hypothetical protein